jgi:flavin-dependent dehydrogenase
MKQVNTDVLVIGAGPSGCIASAYLNSQNIAVQVVEKSKFPRPVVGESLIPRVMDHFDEVGLVPALEAEGFEKKWGARFIKGEQACIFDFSKKYGNGWDWTWQVPRAHFDDVVAKEVQKQGVPISFEKELIDISFDENGHSVAKIKDINGDLSEIKAKFVIDASGYGRVLPRLLSLDTPSSLSKHSSIFTHIEDINRGNYENGTLISFDILETQVWLWVIPFSNGKTSVGIVGPTDYIEQLSTSGNTAEALTNAIIKSDFYKERFNSLPFEFQPVLLKNYSCAVKKMFGKGFALTGNSSEFLDPVFSSGVAFASESGILAAKLITRELKGEKVDWQLEYEDYMKRGIDVFSTYVKEWYTGNLQTLFFHEPANQEVKQQICAVLAGYVWDETNPFVRKHENVVRNMAYTIEMQKQS